MKRKLTGKCTLWAAVILCLMGLFLNGANASPPEPTPTPSPAPDVRTWLGPYQTPSAEPAPSDGRLLEVVPSLIQVKSSPSGAVDQQTFYSIADATVLQGYPTANAGNVMDMWAGYDEYLDPNGEIVRSLVRFDITGLPPDHEITEATLRLYLVGSWDYPDTSRTITTYRITSSWSESSVTWNNKPSYGGAHGSASIESGEWDWYEFDVTDLVSAWYDGTYTNHGIMLRGPEVSGDDSSWRAFGTRESSTVPELVVTYGTSTPPTISGLPDQTLEANTSLDKAIDLWAYASDDESPDSDLDFTIDNTPEPNAGVSIDSNRYIDINPATDWTGQTNVTIRVTDPDGLSDTDSFQVEVTPPQVPPTITSLTPNSGNNNEVVHITNLAGSNFQPGATVRLIKTGEADIVATNVVVLNPHQIICDFDLRGVAPGLWCVRVTNLDAQCGDLANCFTVRGLVYLPLVMNGQGPTLIPDIPVLDAIDNGDGDGNYSVSWNAVALARTYTLQEDDNTAFSSPETRYRGSGTSWDATGKSMGTYYYRVRASNESGSSAWSNTMSVVVEGEPTGPEPGHYTGTSSVSFDVTEGQEVCDFEIRVPFGNGACPVRFESCSEIVNNEFTLVETDPWFQQYDNLITGRFDTRTSALGNFSVHFCRGTLNLSPSEGTWEASK